MLLAYNTNGLAHHNPIEAIELLADLGYGGIGLTIDHALLDPSSGDCRAPSLPQLQETLRRLGMRSVVETGARFLLDSRQKHEPTLMTADPEQRNRRIEFLQYAVRVAAELQSDCVSLWSGILRDPLEDPFQHLIDGLAEVCEYAQSHGVLIGFEPEPGMFINTMERFDELLTRFDHPALRLTIDVGHLHCQGETPIDDHLRRWSSRLVNMHIEDMRFGVHEHLMFGEGEIEFPPVFAALAEIGYQGLVQVELSRHSHQAPEAAQRAMDCLKPLLPPSNTSPTH